MGTGNASQRITKKTATGLYMDLLTLFLMRSLRKMPKHTQFPLPWQKEILNIALTLDDRATIQAIHTALAYQGFKLYKGTLRRALNKWMDLGFLYEETPPRKPGQVGKIALVYKRAMPLQDPPPAAMVLTAIQQLKEHASLSKIQNKLAQQGYAVSIQTLKIALNKLMNEDKVYQYLVIQTGNQKKIRRIIYRLISA